MIRPFAAIMAMTGTAVADVYSADKRHHHLFNPTPHELMRNMATDRPDTTESPYTVDAGHLQVELSFIEYTRDAGTDSFSVMPTNLRIGVLHNLEFAIVLEPLLHVESANDAGVITSDSGFGNIQLRAKFNVWGNDRGDTALAIMPFVTFPTAPDSLGHDHVEGGLILPFAMDLDDHWGLGLMAEFDAVYDEGRDTYDLELLHTAVLGRDIARDLGAYIEYIGVASGASDADYQASVGFGMTYALGPDLQLDAGINIGLNDAADDLNPFIGMSIRF